MRNAVDASEEISRSFRNICGPIVARAEDLSSLSSSLAAYLDTAK